MGKFSRDKGARFERQLVGAFQAAGIAAERVPLSGAAGGRYSGDVSAPIGGADRLFEVKKRAEGFSLIYRWLGNNYALALGADRCEPLVCLRLKDFLSLAVAAGNSLAPPAIGMGTSEFLEEFLNKEFPLRQEASEAAE